MKNDLSVLGHSCDTMWRLLSPWLAVEPCREFVGADLEPGRGATRPTRGATDTEFDCEVPVARGVLA